MPEAAQARTVFAAFVKDELEAEDKRKESFEARGMAVITSSGTIVTILFSLAAIVTATEHYTPPDASLVFLFGALALLIVAAVLAILTNAPLMYWDATPEGMAKDMQKDWATPESVGEARTVGTRLRKLDVATRRNNLKALLLVAAMSAEVLGILLVAIAVGIILVQGVPAASGSPVGTP